MKVRSKIWLETDSGKLVIGEGRLGIFQAIERTGSMSAAARELNMSYRAVWGKVRATEQRLGVKLVEGIAGGPKHGGAKLTTEARELIDRFGRFERQAKAAVEKLAARLLVGSASSGCSPSSPQGPECSPSRTSRGTPRSVSPS